MTNRMFRIGSVRFICTLIALMPAAPAFCAESHPPIPIRFSLAEPGLVTLVVEDAEGRRVRNLLSETQFPAGENVAWWDGLDDLGRDPDAARHGLYQLPARFVSPGEYRVRGLVHPPIHLRYEFSIYNAGSPAWETEDNRGGWLANHTPPSAVLFIPERDANRSPAAPSPGGCILAGSDISEGGHGLAWLDLNGRKRYGQMWVGGVWTGASHLARDAGSNRVAGVGAFGQALAAIRLGQRHARHKQTPSHPILEHPSGGPVAANLESEFLSIMDLDFLSPAEGDRIMHMQKWIMAAVLAALAAGGSAHAAETGLTIPRLATPPTIDGTLAPEEWDGATRVTGLVDQFSGHPVSRQSIFWIGYDEKNLYLAQRSTVQPREWSPKTPPIWFDKSDSSFVMGLAPGRINRGDEPSHYLLRVNLYGQTIAQEITWRIKGVRLTFPHPAWQVTPEIKSVFNAERTEWTSEVAIPLASMKVDAVKDGETWGLLMARDYEAADQTATVVSSDWRFGDGRRHYGRAFYNHYRLEKEYAPVRLAGVGASAKPVTPAATAGVAHLNVAAVPDFSFVGYHKGGGMPVSDTTLKQYGVYTGSGERELTATPYDPITGVFYARLNIGNLPEPRRAARGEIAIRKAGVVNPFVVHPIADLPPDGKDVVRRVRFHLPDLKPGVYQATASIYNAEGALIGEARQNFIRYDHAQDLPWLGNTLGATDKVLPPWTPIAARPQTGGTSLDLSCWGRTYHVGASGLFTGIDTAAQSGIDPSTRDILAGPVRVEVIQDGKAVALSASGLKEVKTAAHEASYRGELSGTGWRIVTRGRMEYDGYALHRLRILPPAAQSEIANPQSKIERLRLVIPLKPEEATHLHATAGNWFRGSVSSIALPATSGVLWHSGQSHALGVTPHTQTWGGLMTAGDFKPSVWIGGPHRGLAFMADNDRGWIPDDEKKVHAIEVVRDGDKVNLVLNLVARPFTFTAPREIVFSLQATPIRPLTANFRDRLARLNLQGPFPGRDPDGWDWNGSMFWLSGQHLIGGHGSQPYPLNWDRNIKKRKEWEGRGAIFTPYQSQLNLMAFGEVDDPRMPKGKQSSDVYGYLYPHMAAGCLEHGNLSIAKPDLEYRLWCYQAWIKGSGLQGLYFDQTEPILGANPAAGCGYVLDLPDRPQLHGRVQPGYLLTNTREFYKRLRTLFVENGVDDPMIWIHDTDATMISAFAFVGAFLDGENTPYLTAEQPFFDKKYDPARMQALANHAKLGIGSVWLDMIQGDGGGMSNELKYKVWRCVQGYARVHDFADRWNYLPWEPFDPKKPMTFLSYWDPEVAAALKTDAPDILASAYRQDNRLQVFVFNRSDQKRDGVQIRVDAAALGLPKGQTVKATNLKGWEGWGGLELDLSMDWKAADSTGTLTLTVQPHDYRLVLLEAVAPGQLDKNDK